MFQQRNEFEQIEDQAILWRYQDLPRYLDLLLKQQLFFCRADRFEDPFEGKYSPLNKNERPKDQPHETGDNSSGQQTLQDADVAVEKPVEDSATNRTFITINSWHSNTEENYAMWKIYAKGTYGLAIQTTYKRLKSCFTDTQKAILIGKVSYYNEHDIPVVSEDSLKPFLCKRKIYEYENEIRCCYVLPKEEKDFSWQDQDSNDGIFINVDLNTLIERIYISPYSPSWIVDIVKGINEKFGIDKEIVHSSVFDSTAY